MSHGVGLTVCSLFWLRCGKVKGFEQLVEFHLCFRCITMYNVDDLLLHGWIDESFTGFVAMIGALAAYHRCQGGANGCQRMSLMDVLVDSIQSLSHHHRLIFLEVLAILVFPFMRQYCRPLSNVLGHLLAYLLAQAYFSHFAVLIGAYCPPYRNFIKIDLYHTAKVTLFSQITS